MRQFLTVYRKEMLQAWRKKQLIWVPLVLMLIAVIDLLTYYYLPEIIELSGGLPEGTTFEAATIKPSEAVLMGLEQLSFIGTLIIIAVSMGTIARERQSGLAEIIFTKPINSFSYVAAKWFSFVTVSILSLFLALLLNWYYTNILFDKFGFIMMVKVFLFYSLWFVLVISVTIFYNSFLHKSSIVFAFSVGTLFLMSLLNTTLGHRLTYFPNQLTNYIGVFMTTDNIPTELYMTSLMIGIFSFSLLVSSFIIFKGKKL